MFVSGIRDEMNRKVCCRIGFEAFRTICSRNGFLAKFSLMRTQETIGGIKVPRPTEQRYSVALFFQDYVPRFPKYKFSLRAILMDGLPVGAPRLGRQAGYFRTTPYRRVDIGASVLLVGEKTD